MKLKAIMDCEDLITKGKVYEGNWIIDNSNNDQTLKFVVICDDGHVRAINKAYFSPQ